MIHIAIITPVPDIIHSAVENSMIRQAIEKGLAKVDVVNLRDFAKGNYRQIDDSPFGGGDGMVMMAEPLFLALDHWISIMGKDDLNIIYPSPQGVQWTHHLALEFSQASKMIFICGHYKGVDERVLEKYVTHEYSLGDYVVTSGELPALIMADSVIRLIPGVLNSYGSAMTDSYAQGLLDAPNYTRPREINDMSVPDILFSGHHEKIKTWRQKHRESRTESRRPDLWKKYISKLESAENKK